MKKIKKNKLKKLIKRKSDNESIPTVVGANECTIDIMDEWSESRKNATTIEDKIKYNVWDDIDDFIKVLQDMRDGKWLWCYSNFDNKYIELRVDMRDGGCIIKNGNGDRISPEQLAYQNR